MHYFGGKFRTSKQIAEVLNSFHPSTYYEPFCGGLWVTVRVVADEYLLSDNNQHLITLYQSMMDGWVPPEYVDEATYQFYRLNQDPLDPMTAFVGIGCSFSGKWFGGYARNKPRKGRTEGDDYVGADKRSLLKKLETISDRNYAANARNSCNTKIKLQAERKTTFTHQDFKAIDPMPGALIYCDPPYQNTTNGYSSSATEFWETMRLWSETCSVVVSEYQAPDDFVCVAEFPTMTEIRGKTGRDPRVERLFMTI